MPNLTYQGRSFYLDGEPFVILSGAMHYFRIPREYWRDRLLKLKECGFNTVETYVPWNLHEPREGEFNFEGMLDVVEYVKIAEELGLLVMLRPGPYICAEWDFGGLPAWLLKYRDIELRCMDETYLSKVRRFFGVLFDKLRPHFAPNGGNIVLVAVENEYGSYGNDHNYLNALVDMYKEMDVNPLLFTADGPSTTMLTGGTIPGVLSFANFGSKPESAAATMFKRFPDQPFVCAEYWNGWFEHWGDQAYSRDQQEVLNDFKTFVDNDWSINVYMFHGGTNFGFMAGANKGAYGYSPTITSYDYGATLTEAGDRTETYYRMRDILVEKYGDKVPPITATETPKAAYGKVQLCEQARLFDNIDNLSAPVHSATPKYMEDIGQNHGFILYRTALKGPMTGDGWLFHYTHLADRAHVYVDGDRFATFMRDKPVSDSDRYKPFIDEGKEVCFDVLVENLGRLNYGRFLRDRKGMVGISMGNQYHYGWDMYPLPMDNLDKLDFKPAGERVPKDPIFMRGYLDIEGEPCDTFLGIEGFGEGFVTVNGFNLGRYWDIGPTKTLYVPAPMLKKGRNEIIVFDSDGKGGDSVELFDKPNLGK